MSFKRKQPLATVRAASESDAEELARLVNALDLHEGLNGRVFSRESVLRDGFDANPLFSAFVLEAPDGSGRLCGYLLWFLGYDTDRARPKFWISDLFVDEAWRGLGLGRKLIDAALQAARARGCGSLALGVRADNVQALDFYRRIGLQEKALLLEIGLTPLP